MYTYVMRLNVAFVKHTYEYINIEYYNNNNTVFLISQREVENKNLIIFDLRFLYYFIIFGYFYLDFMYLQLCRNKEICK